MTLRKEQFHEAYCELLDAAGAQVSNQGGTAVMKLRFRKMSEAIINRLKADDLI
jgi:hypothetical protein